MMGPSGGQGAAGEADRGLIPRVLEEIFVQMARRQAAAAAEGRPLHYRCSCSYLQVYNDVLTDLLEGDASAMLSGGGSPVGPRIRESAERGIFVENLKELRLRTPRDALQVLARGAANRRTASTFMNATSSRSHAVFIVKLEHVTKGHGKGKDRVCSSWLTLVDLAGSERQQKASENKSTSPTGGGGGTGADVAWTSAF